VTTFSGGIKNGGLISAVSGIEIGGGQFSGGVTNSGTISAVSAGIGLGTATGFFVPQISLFTGNLANTGKIAAATGIGVFGGSVLGAIVDSGTIRATQKGILVSGRVVSDGILVGSHGAILAGSTAILVENTVTFASDTTNSGVISAAHSGIYFDGISTFTGAITNKGKITGGSAGIAIRHFGSFLGGIHNSGRISAFTAIAVSTGSTVGNNISTGGGITNTGTISAFNHAINVNRLLILPAASRTEALSRVEMVPKASSSA
jgi:hypothetical protein